LTFVGYKIAKSKKEQTTNMASSVLRGQTALCKLPPAPHIGESTEETITTYSLPVQLKIGNNVKRKGTASGVLGSGMDVFKVSKVSLTTVIYFYFCCWIWI
jgi:hypothetical protein